MKKYQTVYYSRSKDSLEKKKGTKVHIVDTNNNQTVCGKKLNERWVISENEPLESTEITCNDCYWLAKHKEKGVFFEEEEKGLWQMYDEWRDKVYGK